MKNLQYLMGINFQTGASLMKEQQLPGSIVNIASVVARQGCIFKKKEWPINSPCELKKEKFIGNLCFSVIFCFKTCFDPSRHLFITLQNIHTCCEDGEHRAGQLHGQ